MGVVEGSAGLYFRWLHKVHRTIQRKEKNPTGRTKMGGTMRKEEELNDPNRKNSVPHRKTNTRMHWNTGRK